MTSTSISHHRAAIVSSGDEIMLGQLQDTNARWIAEQLVSMGIKPVEFASVGDDATHIASTLERLSSSVPLIIMTGGLGPTEGDLTRAGLAQALGDAIVRDDRAYAELDAKLRARGRSMTDAQARQATRPAGATCLSNAVGTAPGLHAVLPVTARRSTPCDVVCLPGPPNELKPMWTSVAAGLLRPPPGQVIVTRLLTVVGIAESDLVKRLGPLMLRDRSPLVGVTASDGVLTIRIRCEKERDAARSRALVEADAAEIARQLATHVVSDRGVPVPAAVIDMLRQQTRTLTTVESCTGGMLGQMLTDVPGSSAAYVGGWVTYSNEMKTKLIGVDPDLIAEHGAVSEPVARAMAIGGLERSGVHAALAITGVAGPDGGTPTKPVGTVWVALANRWSIDGPITVDARKLSIPGSRADVRRRAAGAALAMLWFRSASGSQPMDQSMPRLLWESASLAPSAPV
ncbi:MAG: CinA family nicotinamide mononucleotide deamidase-related protein [Phycisphaerales bacterium]|nr:CinA family nicotinamide mononucleotide deamidase-related protein [Phycisphaerales bacterium]